MLENIEAMIPLENEPTGFKTPHEAIAFSQALNRARRNGDIDSCIGQVIDAVDWCDDAFMLQLNNRKVLHLRCERNVVDLAVRDDVPKDFKDGSRTPEVVSVRLGDQEFIWKRGELLRGLPGNTLYRVHASQFGFLLYVTKTGILATDVFIDCLRSRPFLFWTPTD